MATRKKTPDILSDLLGNGTKPAKIDSTNLLSGSEILSSDPGEKTQKNKDTIPDTPPPPQDASPIELPHPGKEKEPADTDTGERLNFLVFSLEDQGYALPLDKVEQALRMVAVVHIPEAPPWIAGLINFHGHGMPVLNLRMRLGHPPREAHFDDRLIIVNRLGNKFAVIVDNVSEVLEMPAHELQLPTEAVSESGPLTAVIQRGEGLILVLDAHRLMPAGGEAVC